METPSKNAATPVRRVVIAGGGTAGWCAAVALSRMLGKIIDITLVESEDIGTIGVGEATIPTIRGFHELIGLNERDFLRETNGTIKLGIGFENWARDGDRYIHAFGVMGRSHWMAPFHHMWLQARAEGYDGEIGEHCLEWVAAKAGRFGLDPKTPVSYAYHLDASLYGRMLRRISEAAGVKRVEGKIAGVEQDAQSGFITALALESGVRIGGDLFIDCTGFRGLLIEQTLKTGYDDWTQWLPTDSAFAVQTESHGPLTPFTRAIAHQDGWRWRIPLQTRVGNGLVFCSRFLSDDDARQRLLGMLDSPALFDPRLIRYQTGSRRKTWNKNCIAMGLSSGFIEPLESTSIHLFQIAVTRLMQLFPYDGCTDALASHYNMLSRNEMESVRDFVVLHYKLNQRDEPFWRERAEMPVPDSLAERIGLFAEGAIAYQTPEELFRVDSWVQVMLGQRLEPKGWHQLGRLMPEGQLRQGLQGMRASISRAVAAMPSHEDFIAQYARMKEAAD